MKIKHTHFDTPSPMDLFLPEGTGPFGLICMTPILGRLLFLQDLFIEMRLARFFASQGFACALIDRPIFEFTPSKGLEQIQDYLATAASRNQAALDALLNFKEIDPARTASFGISFGAIVNLLWAAREPRLACHVFALGGVQLAEIFVTSRDPLMKSYQTAAFKQTGLSGQALGAALKNIFCPDPLELCPKIRSESVLMVLARFDHVVRYSYQQDLWEALGRPEKILLPLGHYTSLAALPFLKFRAAAFFKRKFSMTAVS